MHPLCRFHVLYGSSSCIYGRPSDEQQTTLEFRPGEMITEIDLYHDVHRIYSRYKIIAGLSLSTNLGISYGVFGRNTTTKLTLFGEDLLYFHGRSAKFIDAVGAQFGKC